MKDEKDTEETGVADPIGEASPEKTTEMPATEAPQGSETPSETEGDAGLDRKKAKPSTKKKAVAAAVALAIVTGLGIGGYAYSQHQTQAAAQREAQEQAADDARKADEQAKKEAAERLAKAPRPIDVSIEADGWQAKAGAFELTVKDASGKEAAKLTVLPAGTDVAKAIEELPEGQRDAVKKAYTAEGSSDLSESPELRLKPGEYTAELTGIPSLEDGTTYKTPEAAKLTVEKKKDEGDESAAAKVSFKLEKVDPADEDAVEAAIEALPEGQRQAAREQYQQKAEKKQAASGSGASQPSGNAGSQGAAKPSGGDSGGNAGNGGSSGGNTGGTAQPSQPQPPAHAHSFTIPVTQSQWQDGEGYQRIGRFWVVTQSGNKGPFGSANAAYDWISQDVQSGGSGGSVLDDSYDTWTKAPGYYDVVVGYRCSCGASQ